MSEYFVAVVSFCLSRGHGGKLNGPRPGVLIEKAALIIVYDNVSGGM